jgi:hypothetical protein
MDGRILDAAGTTMNACPEFVDRLAPAAELAPPGAIDPVLAAHLESCAGCRAALDVQRQVRSLLQSRPALAASPALRVRVREAIERDQSLIAGVDFRRWTWRLVPIAAAVALATVIGVTGAGNGLPDTAETSDLPVSASLYTPDVSAASALSLILHADVDDRLDAYVTPESR